MNNNNTILLDEKIEGALCYIFGIISGIIFLVSERNKFVKFHALQSICISIYTGIILLIFTYDQTIIFMYGDFILVIIALSIIISIFLMFKSLKGERYRIFECR